MFQVFLIIFWATIRLQSRGDAVCDPSVGGADSSPQGEPKKPLLEERCHEVTEGIRVNPQKVRHLLCSFCPYEMRSMSRKGRELCPEWVKEGGKTAI